MALSQSAPGTGKVLATLDGTKYAYIYSKAVATKPTFLLLHGFPSSSYDWRHQIKSLSELGYGVIAPDLLGYGDTDKPTDLERYKLKKMSADVAQILDEESLEKVIGVGHDWWALHCTLCTKADFVFQGFWYLIPTYRLLSRKIFRIYIYVCYIHGARSIRFRYSKLSSSCHNSY